MSRAQLRVVNNILSLMILVLGIYITLSPLLPFWYSYVNRPGDSATKGFVYQSRAAAEAGVTDDQLQPFPEDNRIVIPSIGVDEAIIEGQSASALEMGGVWKRPRTSIPIMGSNTVIAGHRYTYGSGPKPFFNLDKVAKDDVILVYWEGEEYAYRVDTIFEVDPTRIDIEEPTTEPILTIYTCTPVWTAKNRLVVQAKKIYGDPAETEVEENEL
jgi:LPXTG-site transpeptidase (sortase) family protein